MNICIYKLESIIYTKLIENDIGVEEDIFLIISYFILRNPVGGIHVANPLLYILTTVSITILIPWIAANNIIHSFRIICIMYTIVVFSIYI